MLKPHCAIVLLKCTGLAIFLAACTVVGPRLSHAEVISIADATAHEIMKIDLRQYHPDAPDYVHSDQSWLVGYRRKNRRIGNDGYFAVHVYDHTGMAEVIVSEPRSTSR
jgi:hypothetical protein